MSGLHWGVHTSSFLPIFQNQKKNWPEFNVIHHFSRPNMHIQSTSSPITMALRLPRGVPLRWPIFKFCPPGSPLACKLIKMKNHGIFCLSQQITLPHDKYWGEIPSAMQIPSPIPFCRLPPMGVWAHGSSATDACIIDSSSAGIAGRWEPTM